MNTNPFALRPNRRRRLPEGGPAHWFSFVGAGALIAVGYIDPGNWATALGAGAGYGYQLLGMVVLSSLMAMLLQWLSSRLGVVTGRDLAQVCRERSGPRRTIFLWLTSEVAIIACDVAEVVGSAVALQLLLGVSLTVGVLMSAVCTFALLALQQIGGRKLEAVIALLIGFVGLCFVIELALARPDWHAALAGTAPSPELLRNAGMLWLAAGIVGATVMPHNLYLHSSLVKHHAPDNSDAQIKAALHVVNIDTIGSLLFAFVINAALLIVAAAVFHASGHRDVTDLADAHRLIAPLLGTRWAGILFAAALLACGLSATVTGTLAGQAVMEGFLQLRLPRWKRALLTRALAIGPALVAVTMFGQEGSNQLLVASQVVLSLQLPLAVVPLIRYASDTSLMRDWRVHGVPLVLAWMSAAFIILLNGALLWQVALGE
ncbi:Divalent metal cation transporter MntH [Paraburkholderia graminis C4D1M]|jgi:manganese transport protein|uniref:Mn2+/Fe2+ transporter, NRAMP family n=1 Tax=Paraburkholderia graminis (strain ATCC 700544 / DSM 17151 / LMG 18924 / NCIMB 13744 / C4D1M) TaxID=396598 RepID=B1G760_PARG4|nr:Nramp family divalent metal transporter [Paraburkholderia graminis]EDT08030.1 Mn2+/Fe2+ transporter, NRAMP family [Paraburkholderia graminis C4D1M]CAB3642142.1 Divalent metal cation transporter MntH [Paraburkholderia graminis C4D1M]